MNNTPDNIRNMWEEAASESAAARAARWQEEVAAQSAKAPKITPGVLSPQQIRVTAQQDAEFAAAKAKRDKEFAERQANRPPPTQADIAIALARAQGYNRVRDQRRGGS